MHSKLYEISNHNTKCKQLINMAIFWCLKYHQYRCIKRMVTFEGATQGVTLVVAALAWVTFEKLWLVLKAKMVLNKGYSSSFWFFTRFLRLSRPYIGNFRPWNHPLKNLNFFLEFTNYLRCLCLHRQIYDFCRFTRLKNVSFAKIHLLLASTP